MNFILEFLVGAGSNLSATLVAQLLLGRSDERRHQEIISCLEGIIELQAAQVLADKKDKEENLLVFTIALLIFGACETFFSTVGSLANSSNPFYVYWLYSGLITAGVIAFLKLKLLQKGQM